MAIGTLSGFPGSIQVVLGPIWDGTNGLDENDVLTLTKVSGQNIWTEDGTLTADTGSNRIQFCPAVHYDSGSSSLSLAVSFQIASTGTTGGWASGGGVTAIWQSTTENRYVFGYLFSNWTAASSYYLSVSIGWQTGYYDYNADVFKSIQAAGLIAGLPGPLAVEWTEPAVTGSQSGGCWPLAVDWTEPTVTAGTGGLAATVPSPQPVAWSMPAVTPQKSAGVSPLAVEWTEPAVTGSQPAGEPPAVIDWTLPDVTPHKSMLCDPLVVDWSLGDVTADLASLVPRAVLLRSARRRATGLGRSRSRLRRSRFAELLPPGGLTRFNWTARGKYRVFNAAGYRFYRSNTGPPAEGDAVWATSSSLAYTPAGTFADGTWYLSVSYFNGVLDSGFLPLGSRGESYLKLVVDSGQQTGNPPPGPQDWRLVPAAAGAVRILAWLVDSSTTAPGEWAIAYTTDGNTPAEDSPTVTVAMNGGAMKVLDTTLPAASHGATVKVRLQTRRNDGTLAVPSWVYSDGSTVETITADAEGPTAPLHLAGWPGLGVRP